MVKLCRLTAFYLSLFDPKISKSIATTGFLVARLIRNNSYSNFRHLVTELGAGCKSCHQQFGYAKEAVKNLGLDIEIEYITDLAKVMEYGVRSMYAIVVNEKVISVSKVLSVSDLKNNT